MPDGAEGESKQGKGAFGPAARLRVALRRRLRRLKWDWIPVTGLAALAGWLLAGFGVPMPWLMGPMLSSLLLAAASRRTWTIPGGVRSVAQMLLGLAVAFNLDLRAVAAMGGQLAALFFLVLSTMALSLLNGYFLWRWAGVDRAAGFLGSVPGAASAMVAMGPEMGVDARLVAVLQYLRVLIVAVLAPFIVEHFLPLLPAAWLHTEPAAFAGGVAAGEMVSGTRQTPWPPSAGDVALMILFAVAGVRLGTWLRLPSRYFLGPWLVAMVGSHLLGAPRGVPPQLLNVSLVLLGTWIGLLFDFPLIRQLGRIALINVLLIVMMLFLSLGLSWVFARLAGVSLLTAFVGNAPGAMEVLIALSIKLGIDTPLVASLHMIRFAATLLLGPAVVRWLTGAGEAAEKERAGG